MNNNKDLRLDKYLKVKQVIKRRTIANKLCDSGLVSVNGKVVRASYEVKENDQISIQFGARIINHKAENV